MMNIINRAPATVGTIQERTRMCGICYAGRNQTCENRNKDNAQTAYCLAAYRRQSA